MLTRRQIHGPKTDTNNLGLETFVYIEGGFGGLALPLGRAVLDAAPSDPPAAIARKGLSPKRRAQDHALIKLVS